MPVEVVEYRLDEEELDCPKCGEKLHEMGKETVRVELKIIPAQAVIVQHVRYTYSCRNCEKTGTEVPVIKAPVKNAVIKVGFAEQGNMNKIKLLYMITEVAEMQNMHRNF